MGDFNKPVKTDQYESLLAHIRELFADVATLIDSRRASPTNIPTYAKRWDAINNKLLSFEGGTWISKVLSLAGGGTGSSSASGARANLGVDSSDQVSTKVSNHNAVTNPHSASSTAVSDRLVLRDASGRAQVADPSVSADIATKGYVDTNLSIPSGTSMLFNQVTAPAGWTKKADWANVAALHVGNDYATGGENDPRSYTTGISIANHADHVHSGPSHTHSGPNHQHTGPRHNHQWYKIDRSTSTTKDHSYLSDGSLDFSIIDGASTALSSNLVLAACIGIPPAPWSEMMGDRYTNNASGYTGYGGTGNTGAGGTGNTGSASVSAHSITQSTYKPSFVRVIAATKD